MPFQVTTLMQPIESMSVRELLDELGAKTPAPGGGAVASMAGGLAAALGGMVIAYSIGKKSLAQHADALEAAARRLLVARNLLLRLAQEDASAYELYSELSRLPEGDERRTRELPAAIQRCVQAPRSVLAASVDVARLLETLAPITNRHLHSDLGVAGVMCEAAARSAAWNVQVNLPLLADAAARETIAGETRHAVDDVRQRVAAIEQAAKA